MSQSSKKELVYEQCPPENPCLNGLPVGAEFVFDRQARAHIILACKQLNKTMLGLSRKPSYWDLPVCLQAKLVSMQLRVGAYIAASKGLPASAWHVEIHLGTWVSGSHIHAHVVLPTGPYFEIREEVARAQGRGYMCRNDQANRKAYVEKTAADQQHYKELDLPLVQQAARSEIPPPTCTQTHFESISFDADAKGTAAIDVKFSKAFMPAMPQEELTNALSHLWQLCQELQIEGCHLLLPAPDYASWQFVRLVLPAERFVACLPISDREAWLMKWVNGNPHHEAH
jgi:hypothetical protein